MEQLAVEFFRTAMKGGEPHSEELERVQLQQAISAMSDRMLLLQNIEEEKRIVD